jgi:GNAT superfamily N-acetyltransferase
MFDGPESPCTQTFGLGLWQPARHDGLDTMEDFYRRRNSPVFHEVSPLADAGLAALLARRGYRPCEFTSVLYRPIDTAGLKASTTLEDQAGRARSTASEGVVQAFRPAAIAPASVSVRLIEKGEGEIYARVSAEGWSEFGVGDFVLNMARLSGQVEGQRLFLAEIDGAPIAAGALGLADGIAHLAGASTVPAGRRRGAQLALLDHRLRYAAAHGCDIALMGALPGSGSQRNAERHGFRIAYTRIKWGQI